MNHNASPFALPIRVPKKYRNCELMSQGSGWLGTQNIPDPFAA